MAPGADADMDQAIAVGVEALSARSRAIAPAMAALRALHVEGRLAVSLEQLAASLTHMHANRLLRSAARARRSWSSTICSSASTPPVRRAPGVRWEPVMTWDRLLDGELAGIGPTRRSRRSRRRSPASKTPRRRRSTAAVRGSRSSSPISGALARNRDTTSGPTGCSMRPSTPWRHGQSARRCSRASPAWRGQPDTSWAVATTMRLLSTARWRTWTARTSPTRTRHRRGADRAPGTVALARGPRPGDRPGRPGGPCVRAAAASIGAAMPGARPRSAGRARQARRWASHVEDLAAAPDRTDPQRVSGRLLQPRRGARCAGHGGGAGADGRRRHRRRPGPPLLAEATAWVLNQRLDSPAGLSLFPRFVGPGISPVPARFAWCYGDPESSPRSWPRLAWRATSRFTTRRSDWLDGRPPSRLAQGRHRRLALSRRRRPGAPLQPDPAEHRRCSLRRCRSPLVRAGAGHADAGRGPRRLPLPRAAARPGERDARRSRSHHRHRRHRPRPARRHHDNRAGMGPHVLASLAPP